MTGVRNTGFVAIIALAAGSVCLIAIQQQVQRPTLPNTNFDSRVVSFAELQDGDRCPPVPIEPDQVGRYGIPKSIYSSHEILPALDVRDGQIPESALHPGSKTNVPAPDDHSQIATSTEDESANVDSENPAVRDVIERELAHATREEREIWFDELKTLPAGVVRDLLQVRKQLRALPRVAGGIPERLASANPSTPSRNREIPAEPASRKIRFNLPDDYSVVASLEAAISQLRHNLVNTATPGFKRLRVTLVDSYASVWPDSAMTEELSRENPIGSNVRGEGCRVAPLRLDLKQGIFKKTGRQLDLAIDGDGFFMVRKGETELLTRCGAFDVDRDRHLCLTVASELVLLQPAVAIPASAQEIQITAEGTVMMLKMGETNLSAIGQINLARVASPARLQPLGNTLFATNADSGPIEAGLPMTVGFGVIQQGCLEQSNVELQTEIDQIEDLTAILKALPFSNSRPVTATSPQSAPPR